MALFLGVVLLLRCSAALVMFHYSVVFRLFCQYSIRGHKGQNSTGTQCRGFLVLASQCRGFLVLESRFSPRISMSWFFGLGILMSWFFGFGIPMSWYICLHCLVFVIIVKTKNCETKIVVEKYFNCPNLCKSICIMYA